MVQQHRSVPTLRKRLSEFTDEEIQHWVTLGWAEAVPVPKDDWTEAYENPTWDMRWEELTDAQREAAKAVGWDEVGWQRSSWPLPGKPWDDLSEEMRRHLVILGECLETWNRWNGGANGVLASSGAPASSGVTSPSATSGREASADNQGTQSAASGTTAASSSSSASKAKPLSVGKGFGGHGSLTHHRRRTGRRHWGDLNEEEASAARAIGFTEALWDLKAEAPFEDALAQWSPNGFEACITQGCDLDSVDPAERLAKSHPGVYASFGCHPKGAWTFNEEFKARLLEALEATGKKAVAWGEFGLDFSHKFYGRLAANRRLQKVVFAQQLQLAVSLGLPLVLHSRAAERDTLRQLRRWVPRHWKMHAHSMRGSMATFGLLMRDFPNCYFGFSGLLCMHDAETEELCRQCPMDRILLETDAPYLPIRRVGFSHPGDLPAVAERIAEVKGLPLPSGVDEVLRAARENTRRMYGI